MGILDVLGWISVFLELFKNLFLVILLIQGIRLVSFIIKNKGLTNVNIENIIDGEDDSSEVIVEVSNENDIVEEEIDSENKED